MSAPRESAPDGAVHQWFGLSYSTHLVLPRTLMQSMPEDWQDRMVACLREIDASFTHIEQPEAYKVEAATEHIVNELTEAELRDIGITVDYFRGEEPPEGLNPAELAAWEEEHEDPDGPLYYDDKGNELSGHERILLLAPDPVPHYNRGRTYVEPLTRRKASAER